MGKDKGVLPSGDFGRFGGANDSVRFAKNPAGYVEGKSAKHGKVFKALIAGSPSMFAACAASAEEVLNDDGTAFPPSRSLLRLIRRAAGDVFLLHDDPAEARWWAGATARALYRPDAPSGPLRTRPLQQQVAEAVGAVIAEHVAQWLALPQLDSLYTAAKLLCSHAILHTVLGPLCEAERRQWQELLTTQFRGCESLPVEGVPIAGRGLAAGIEAKERLLQLAEARIQSGPGGLLAALVAGADAEGRPPSHAAAVAVFLLHAIVPKAVASALTSCLIELSYSPQGVPAAARLAGTAPRGQGLDPEGEALLGAIVAETLRLHPPLVVAPRGVRRSGANLSSYRIPPSEKEKDEWLCFAGIRAANRDTQRYGADAERFRPSRWLGPDPPAPPLTFGCGGRGCPGQGLAVHLIAGVLRELFAAGVVPKAQCGAEPVAKSLPVHRPEGAVVCRFERVAAAAPSAG